MSDPRRHLPAVGTLLELEGVRALADRVPREVVAGAVRRSIDAARHAPDRAPRSDTEWLARITTEVDRALVRSLRPVVNATGVILHTNLGRAPLAAAAITAVSDVASGYSNLEYDLEKGARGSRHQHSSALLCELTGAADAMVVNNCAAALVLALNTLADGRDAVISRGELVEIGGSFRVPDIMARSGARLVEVGTTNRTHIADYRAALSDTTAAVVSVHRSNFVQQGFVASVPVADLATLASEAGVALVHDFGSGLLADLSPWGLTGEPTARDAVRSGASVVVMSGDKLLGGPQAGIVLGAATAVAAMRANPLARAMRVDKLTLAALEATLDLYRDPVAAMSAIPVLAMITAPADEVRARAQHVVDALREIGGAVRGEIVGSHATVGGGAFPAAEIASFAVRLNGVDPGAADARLRAGRVPVVGRVVDGRLQLDLRTVPEIHVDVLTQALSSALR